MYIYIYIYIYIYSIRCVQIYIGCIYVSLKSNKKLTKIDIKPASKI